MCHYHVKWMLSTTDDEISRHKENYIIIEFEDLIDY